MFVLVVVALHVFKGIDATFRVASPEINKKLFGAGSVTRFDNY